MNIKKEYIQVNCSHNLCPHFEECCRLPTEIDKFNNNQVDIFVVGMGSGRQDAKNHIAFSGPSGKYLRKMILHMWGTKTFNIAISNTVRCRPTDMNDKDREPNEEELKFCLPYLKRDIETINPKALVFVGKSAAESMLPIKVSAMGKFHGRQYTVNNRLATLTFHPSFLIRTYGDFNSKSPNEYDKYVLEDFSSILNTSEDMQTSMDL